MTEQLSVSNQAEVPKHKEALQEKYDQEPTKPQKDLTKVFKKYAKEYLNAYNEAKKNGYSRKKKVA